MQYLYYRNKLQHSLLSWESFFGASGPARESYHWSSCKDERRNKSDNNFSCVKLYVKDGQGQIGKQHIYMWFLLWHIPRSYLSLAAFFPVQIILSYNQLFFKRIKSSELKQFLNQVFCSFSLAACCTYKIQTYLHTICKYVHR